MVLAGLSAVFLMLILVKRELDRASDEDQFYAPIETASPSSVQYLGRSSNQTETTPSLDLAPLQKARSSMDNNHFRKISLTAAELMRTAGASQSKPHARINMDALRPADDDWDPFARTPPAQPIMHGTSHSIGTSLPRRPEPKSHRSRDAENEGVRNTDVGSSQSVSHPQLRPLRLASNSRLRARKNSASYGRMGIPPSPVAEESFSERSGAWMATDRGTKEAASLV